MQKIAIAIGVDVGIKKAVAEASAAIQHVIQWQKDLAVVPTIEITSNVSIAKKNGSLHI